MDDIFDILTSRARAKILRTLYFQPHAAPLRHIAYMSNLPVFSVQNAVRSLIDDEIIKKEKTNRYVLLELNRNHPLYIVLERFFMIEMNHRICMEAKNRFQRAKQVLEFASAANVIFKRAKKKKRAR